MKSLLLILSVLLVSNITFANDSDLETFQKLVEPVIYSESYQVPENLEYIKYVEVNEVPASFKERIRHVKNEILDQIVAGNPQLCRPDYETAETGCLSPLRGSEYYLVYDKGEVLGFVFIGYGVAMNEDSLGFEDTWAYRFIVYKNGHVVQNGFFDLNEK